MKELTENAYSDSTFRFNGKEWEGRALRNKPVTYFSEGASLPRGRGNYYSGARYYDPKISVWLSVDPEATRDPHMTPYHFEHSHPDGNKKGPSDDSDYPLTGGDIGAVKFLYEKHAPHKGINLRTSVYDKKRKK